MHVRRRRHVVDESRQATRAKARSRRRSPCGSRYRGGRPRGASARRLARPCARARGASADRRCRSTRGSARVSRHRWPRAMCRRRPARSGRARAARRPGRDSTWPLLDCPRSRSTTGRASRLSLCRGAAARPRRHRSRARAARHRRQCRPASRRWIRDRSRGRSPQARERLPCRRVSGNVTRCRRATQAHLRHFGILTTSLERLSEAGVGQTRRHLSIIGQHPAR